MHVTGFLRKRTQRKCKRVIDGNVNTRGQRINCESACLDNYMTLKAIKDDNSFIICLHSLLCKIHSNQTCSDLFSNDTAWSFWMTLGLALYLFIFVLTLATVSSNIKTVDSSYKIFRLFLWDSHYSKQLWGCLSEGMNWGQRWSNRGGASHFSRSSFLGLLSEKRISNNHLRSEGDHPSTFWIKGHPI